MTAQALEGGLHEIQVSVNGKRVVARVDSHTLLVEFIRDALGLTGTHVGCDTSQCGACVVEFDGNSVKSCSMLAVQTNGGSITTIEGLDGGEVLHPMQEAFSACHALQCGYCTPGMVMSACDLVRKTPLPTEAEIREWLDGNLCRCTGYNNIVRAISAAARAMADDAHSRGKDRC